ncbi:MAG: transposase, partial [Oscillibacter sp.]|nr:transposase [Oscillibacter sp.]
MFCTTVYLLVIRCLFPYRSQTKRELTNAVLYLVDSGCKWRQLPHDFPPYSTVHSFYRRARLSGLWDR